VSTEFQLSNATTHYYLLTFMMLLRRDMERLFDPVVQDVLRLLSHQVEYISRTKGKRINVGLVQSPSVRELW
jgi:hypothetical protein